MTFQIPYKYNSPAKISLIELCKVYQRTGGGTHPNKNK